MVIVHKGTQIIKTERLILRKYNINDVEDIFANYATDKKVTKFLSWQPYKNIDSLKDFVSSQVLNYTNNIYNWVIEYSGQVIGSVSVINTDEKNESCEIGYCLGFKFWNMGLMTEAVSAVIKFLFLEVGYNRIYAKHDIENPASGKIMTKCNMIYEGRLREHYLRYDGTYSDSLIYSIIKSEFNPSV